MKQLILLLLIIGIGFSSCDGRKTQNQALSDSIEEFKKTVNFETNVYVPKTYIEQDVDTTMSNGFRVKIKTYTDLSNSVRFSKIKDTVNYQTHYRNFKFDITVLKDDKEIYKESFNKQKINTVFNYKTDLPIGANLYNFNKLATLKSINLNDDPSFTNMVLIDIIYGIPESKKSSSHRLFIDENGKSHSVQL
ncbi:hypothetical protein [Winogradskyella endarachnes]|uniref:DUF4738 domain-containing protein n=1 Tax=Winogradskyella endarachnes TaxID=2681965 RepID=A0A6L6U5E6_9FLAO|nr:hypothetical protein [Winogradskyella endarachnes]MUU77370.1 hypothetical protein [Winogradskyella endarachnes]